MIEISVAVLVASVINLFVLGYFIEIDLHSRHPKLYRAFQVFLVLVMLIAFANGIFISL